MVFIGGHRRSDRPGQDVKQRGPDGSGPRCWRSGRWSRCRAGARRRLGTGGSVRRVSGLVPFLEPAPDPRFARVARGLVPAALTRCSRSRAVAVTPAAHPVVSAPATTAAKDEPEQGEEQEDEQDEAQEVKQAEAEEGEAVAVGGGL